MILGGVSFVGWCVPPKIGNRAKRIGRSQKTGKKQPPLLARVCVPVTPSLPPIK